MATGKSAPSTTNLGTDTIRAATLASHAGHKMTRIGPVTVKDNTNPGTFDVWYCQDDHAILIDSKS